MNKRLPLLGVLIALSCFAYAQTTCHSTHVTQARQQADPLYNQQLQQMQAALQKIQATNHIDPSYGARVVRTIPVAVHVIYNTAAENVSDATIFAMIDKLNDDFRKLNSLSGVRAQVLPLATDAEIEFCLAQQTPAGVATTGIERLNNSEACYDPDTETDKMKSTTTGGLNPWDPDHYLNIWIVDICGGVSSGVAGYAYLPTPGMHGSNIDGLVIDYSLGMGANNTTATHEIGHYLGLHHTWGDLGSNACGNVFPDTDDGFSDTPDSEAPNFSCVTNVSCPGNSAYGDQYENFMDYANCAAMYTPQQANYMNSVLTNTRGSLLQSNACTPLGAPTAAFIGTPTSICTGQQVTFTNQTTGASPITYSWSFPGGTPSSSTAANPTVTYNTAGTYNVTLTASNANGSDNEVKTGYIVVSGSTALPLVEGFQGTTFPPAGWSLNNPDGGDAWERTTATGGYAASTASALFDNYNSNNAGQRDWLITPSYNFSGVGSGRIKFDYAYRRYNTTTTLYDSLEVLYSTNCGATWTSIWKKGGVSLQTVTTTSTQSFTPSSTQWATDSVSLAALSGQSNVRFAFVNRNSYGQNLYLDNINIFNASTTPVAPVADFIGTPTTVTAGQTVAFTNLSTNSPTSYSWTFAGGTPGTSTAANPTITYNTPGTYNVSLTASNAGGSDVETKTAYITVIAAGGGSGCDTLTNLFTTDTLTAYVFNGGVNGTGFISGHNSFGDKAKVDFFTNPTPGAQVTGGLLYFAFADPGNPGGSVTARVWNANGANGSPGTVLASQNIPLTTIAANVAAQAITPVTFSTPATVTGNFYFGIELSYANGDSVALYTTTFLSPGNGQGWEQWDDNTWHPYDSVYGDLSNAVFPIICTQSAPAPTASFTASTTSVCAGGSVTFTSTSTNNPTSYSWTINGGTPSASSLQNPTVTFNTPGTYTVSLTVSNANGSNTSTQTNMITVRALPSVTVNTVGVNCFGGSTGSATTTVTSGQTPYTYNWSNSGGTNSGLTNKPAGTYTVTVTDAFQCTAVASGVISQPSAAVSASATANDALCSQPNGSVSVNATGGTAGANGYIYLWSNGQTTASVSNVPAGNYTVTVTDQNGCTTTASTTVQNQPSNVTVSITPTNATCNQNNGSAVAIATGGQFVTGYIWSTGATTGSISNLAAGSYSVTVTNNNGCTASATTSIANIPSTLAVNFNITQANCGATNGAAQAQVTGGSFPYTYLWSTGSTNSIIAGIGAGGYTVTVTDNAGCSVSSVATVANIGAPTLTIQGTSPTCFNGTNGSATSSVSGGTTPYNYNWSSGASTSSVNGLGAGTFVLTVTDGQQCQAVQSVVLTQPNQIIGNVTTTPAACNLATGSVSVSATGGSGNFTYQWTGGQTSATVNNLTAGSYTVTITDNNSCTGTASGTIQSTAGPIALVNGVNGTCQQAPQVDLTATAGTPPYTYLWSNGATTEDISGLAAGNYAVTVTDASGCTAGGTATVTDASGITATVAGQNPSSLSAADGSATATVTAGNAPYTYLWSNGQTSATATNLVAGNYSVTITDVQGCTKVLTVTLTAAIGINDVNVITSVGLYPNPANNTINIAVELTEAQQLQVEMYNHLGQLVFNKLQSDVKAVNEQVDISAFSAGVYYVRVQANGTFKTLKFIKQ